MATYSIIDGQSQTLDISLVPQKRDDTQANSINASGNAALDLTANDYDRTQVILAANARLTTTFHLNGQGVLTVDGDATSALLGNGPNELAATLINFDTTIGGTGSYHSTSGTLNIDGPVASSVSFHLDNSTEMNVNHADTFKASVTLNNSYVFLSGLVSATDYSYAGGALIIYGGGDDHQLASFQLSDATPNTPLFFGLDGAGQVSIHEGGALNQEATLAQHVAPVPAPHIVVVHDNATNADLPDTSTPYTGPVAGIVSQFINVTPDNLNIMAAADNLFIKTGAGNDGIALHGGTNVVDAGGGSNFLTSGTGFDTFFLDARNIPAAASAAGPVPGAIWDTIQNFGHGDATTFWGVGPGTALVWQKNEGAVGHTGLTLHANMPNGSEASLTLAGIDSKAGLSLSYGSSGGSSYLYVKAA